MEKEEEIGEGKRDVEETGDGIILGVLRQKRHDDYLSGRGAVATDRCGRKVCQWEAVLTCDLGYGDRGGYDDRGGYGDRKGYGGRGGYGRRYDARGRYDNRGRYDDGTMYDDICDVGGRISGRASYGRGYDGQYNYNSRDRAYLYDREYR